jgi:AbrB family looped-hinge helix DNA binding protein
MAEARMTSKGQITVPKEVRLQLRLKPGDRVRFVIESDGRVRMWPAKREISSLRGVLPKPSRVVTLEEIDDTIRARAAKLAGFKLLAPS